MKVYLLMKHYDYEDRAFVHSIYATEELANKAKDEMNPSEDDGSEGEFSLWIYPEDLIGG